MSSVTPMEDAIRSKITAAFAPATLEIYNDSHLHSHHKAMVDSTSKETHFRLVIISDAFKSKMQPARHRMVYALLRDEMYQDGGIHALQLRTLTLEEEQRQQAKKAQAAQEKRELKEQRAAATAAAAAPAASANSGAAPEAEPKAEAEAEAEAEPEAEPTTSKDSKAPEA